MKFKHHSPPRFDLPVIGEEFNLRAEQAADGERLARERRQAEADRVAAEQRQRQLEKIFGQPVYCYTRRQAIEDGVLVDLMQPETVGLVREAGFKFPLAMTADAFAATVAKIGESLPKDQDIQGRLWDVLWMLSCAIKAAGSTDRVNFRVSVWDGERRDEVELWSLCGPGDDAAPVITIMLEGED